MTISTRWHAPSCEAPQVVVDGNVPECRSCGRNASALLRRAAEEPAPSYSGINLPSEAPIGQMDLWWPPCVPYTRNGVPRSKPEVSSGDIAILVPQASDSSLSELYTSSLGKDHFRLLYLSGSRLIDSPIHGDLVEYPRDNCPEYETTSYTWGGEDGDATPCKPAYFGKFWDVLFLTRNCWSLLQYLRPSMGTRVVWVDAICINQHDIPERGTQVSSMPHIYRNCMRVIIYPGDHLVRRDQHKFRQRVRHDEITKDGDVDSEDGNVNSVDDSRFDIRGTVLQGRYITRVWIIQELILAPHSILALRHHDLDLTNNLMYSVAQKTSGRRWLEYMGHDHKLQQTTLFEGLRMTSDNQASDPRDRIFGILGILKGNPTYSEIVPDYSISMRDCAIGAMGLTLIISKDIWPLLHVQARQRRSGYPSWVPNLAELAVWADEPPPRQIPVLLETRPESIISMPGGSNTSVCLDLGFARGCVGTHTQRIRSEIPWCQAASIDSASGALTLKLVRMFDKPHEMTRMEWAYDEHGLVECTFAVEGPSAAAWFVSARVVENPKQPCYIFLAYHVQKAPPRYRLRNRNRGNWESDIYAVFATEADISGTFSMVQCFLLEYVICVSVSSPPSPESSLRFWELGQRRDSDSVMSLFETLHWTVNYNAREHRILHEGYAHDRFDPIAMSWQYIYETVSEAMLFDMIIPGKGNAASGFLQLSLSAGRTGSPATVTKEFKIAYANCLQTASAGFNPVVDDEYIWFTLADEEALNHYWNSVIEHIDAEHLYPEEKKDYWRPWGILFPSWFDLQIPGIGDTLFNEQNCKGELIWRPWPAVDAEDPSRAKTRCFDRCTLHEDYRSQGSLSLKYWLPCSEEPRELQMPVRARMPLIEVVEAIRNTELNWLHRHLLAFGEKVGEDVETLLERGPQPEDCNIYLEEWPKSLVDELGFVWRKESVTFV